MPVVASSPVRDTPCSPSTLDLGLFGVCTPFRDASLSSSRSHLASSFLLAQPSCLALPPWRTPSCLMRGVVSSARFLLYYIASFPFVLFLLISLVSLRLLFFLFHVCLFQCTRFAGACVLCWSYPLHWQGAALSNTLAACTYLS